MKIAINRLDRIGRQVYRIAYERPRLEIVDSHDLAAASAIAPLLQFDTTQGRLGPRVQDEGSVVHVDGTRSSVSAGRGPTRDDMMARRV